MEDDRTFYQRRLREELARSLNEPDEPLRRLHWRWAALYEERLAQLDEPIVLAANLRVARDYRDPAPLHPLAGQLLGR